MKINNLIKYATFLFVLSVFIISCSKETDIETKNNNGQIDPTEELDQNSLLTRSVANEDGLDLDCITILFPFDVIDNVDNTHTIESDEDFIALLDSTGDVFIVDFIYPLDVETEDGIESTIASGEELGEIFANCLPNGWDEDAFPAYLINLENSCLTLQYPVTVSKLDGTTETFDDEASFIAALAEEPLFFVFPLSLLNEDGETIVANNVDELLIALFDCNGLDIDTTLWNDDFGFEYIGCYEIVFPFSVELTDGTTVEVNNHMEYCDLLLEGNIQGFAFPLTLIGENGEITVNSQEELDELLEDCWDWQGPDNFGDIFLLLDGAIGFDSIGIDACYEISFPINLEEFDSDGNSLGETSVNSINEILDLISGFPGGSTYSLVYPVTITLNESNEEVELNTVEDILTVHADCE